MEQAICEEVLASGDALGEAAECVRLGELQKALEAEIDAFLGRGRYERSGDGGVRGYRNGYDPPAHPCQSCPQTD
ncbi:MAG: hypothetical protein Kow0074_17910 [Candidatus Zixiibacteriota bacterium]